MRRNGQGRSDHVLEVRRELRLIRSVHGGYVTDAQVASLFQVVGDAGVCADALGLWPRPLWVEKLVGPYPPSLELANPEDTASVDEWGAGGTGT
jgi:hypothetical protein